MGFLEEIFGYTISQEGANELYRAFVYLEVNHSNNYLKLYQSVQKADQGNLVIQAKKYISDSIQSLIDINSSVGTSGKVTLNLDGKIRKQIKKLRTAIE